MEHNEALEAILEAGGLASLFYIASWRPASAVKRNKEAGCLLPPLSLLRIISGNVLNVFSMSSHELL